MDVGRTRLGLDLDLNVDCDPVAGELTLPGGAPRRFTGYAGLIAAVEAIREGQGSRSPLETPDDIAPEPRQGRDAS